MSDLSVSKHEDNDSGTKASGTFESRVGLSKQSEMQREVSVLNVCHHKLNCVMEFSVGRVGEFRGN